MSEPTYAYHDVTGNGITIDNSDGVLTIYPENVAANECWEPITIPAPERAALAAAVMGEVQAVPWWMTNLPDDWPHETRLLPHQKMWRAWIWDGDGLAGTACGNTRDEALNAALRDALEERASE
jgi:hypothetical protein